MSFKRFLNNLRYHILFAATYLYRKRRNNSETPYRSNNPSSRGLSAQRRVGHRVFSSTELVLRPNSIARLFISKKKSSQTRVKRSLKPNLSVAARKHSWPCLMQIRRACTDAHQRRRKEEEKWSIVRIKLPPAIEHGAFLSFRHNARHETRSAC